MVAGLGGNHDYGAVVLFGLKALLSYSLLCFLCVFQSHA